MNKPRVTGIIMSTPLARAAYNGTKTETRRIFKFSARVNNFGKREVFIDKSRAFDGSLHKYLTFVWERNEPAPDLLLSFCPYGQPGDLVYFRETWATTKDLDQFPPSEIPHAAWRTWASSPDCDANPARGRWRSGRFMPRFAARKVYQLKEIGLQPIQEIRHYDIINEGFMIEREENEMIPEYKERLRAFFIATWNRLHADHPGCLFYDSPLVWVLKFGEIPNE